jgi:hypothetical protein
MTPSFGNSKRPLKDSVDVTNRQIQALVQQMIGSAPTVNDPRPKLSNRPSPTSMECELSAGTIHWHYPLLFPPSSQAPYGEGTIALLLTRKYAASASPSCRPVTATAKLFREETFRPRLSGALMGLLFPAMIHRELYILSC